MGTLVRWLLSHLPISGGTVEERLGRLERLVWLLVLLEVALHSPELVGYAAAASAGALGAP